MAGVNVSQGGGRSVNSDINMVPFIDLLMVTIAFLLITAVWVSYSRVEATAQLPGISDGEVDVTNVEATLHIHTHENEFVLAWKQGATTISETHVARVAGSASAASHHELAKKIREEFKRHGSHQDASDARQDRAVLHTDNALPFRELVAVMDAIHATRRDFQSREGKRTRVAAFGIGFAAH